MCVTQATTDKSSVIIVHRLVVHFYFWYLLSHSVRSETWMLAQSVGNLSIVYSILCTYTVALCWTWSAYSTSVFAQVKPGVCSCCCLFTCEKLKNLMFILCTTYEYWSQRSGEERSECIRFSQKISFLKKEVLEILYFGTYMKDVWCTYFAYKCWYISVIKYFSRKSSNGSCYLAGGGLTWMTEFSAAA